MIATKSLADLSLSLQRASKDSRTGTGWVSATAVIAMTVATWLGFVIAGGTWMFYQRFVLAKPPETAPGAPTASMLTIEQLYLQLAFVACVFVVPAMISLVAQSAVLGASGREQRLAILRLIGLTQSDVTRMTMIETTTQTAIGLCAGTILSIATAPFWAFVNFNGQYLSTWEMLLPWWGYPIVWAVVLTLALGASVIGLRRVFISPLGVSRREVPKAMKFWRVGVFFIAIVIAAVMISGANTTLLGTLFGTTALFIAFSAINIIAPFAVQILAKVSTVVPGRVDFIATRRVAANPKGTWRRVASMSFLAILMGMITIMPLKTAASMDSDQVFVEDVVTGVLITFAIGFVLMITATILTQASAVFEQAELTKALNFIGAPANLHRAVALKQTFYPMLLVSLLGYTLGLFMSWLMFGVYAESDVWTTRSVFIAVAYIGSIVAVSLTTMAVDPLRRRLLNQSVRRND